MMEPKRRTHTKSAMPVYPPPVARNLAQQQRKKKYANQPGAMSVRELKNTLKDYYAYHDPFKTMDDIELIVKWAKKRGIKRLNIKLREKYGEDLVSREEDYKKRSMVISRLITPGLVEAHQQDDYDSDEEDAFSSVSNQFASKRPSVRQRSSSVIQDSSIKKRVEDGIDKIEGSASPDEIRSNLIKFYQIVAPERLKTPNGEDPAFLEEILTWTFRFGLPSLANNLRVKYLGYEDLDEYYDEEEEEGDGIQEEGAPGGTGEKLAGEEILGGEGRVKEVNVKPPPKAPPREYISPTEDVTKPPEGLGNLDDASDDVLGKKIKAFYLHYNPARVANGVEDLVQYVRKKGVDVFNAKLRGRYNDDLYTFFGREENEDTDYRVDLFERLFKFYSEHDPSKVGGGLSRIISWTERNGWDALNGQLKDAYGTDLTEQ